MRVILFSLVLALACAARAATPFVTVGVQPTLTLITDSWAFSHEGGSLYYTFFNTYVGSIALGVRSGRVEYIGEYNWKNSRAELIKRYDEAWHVDTLYFRTSTYYWERFADSRLKLGVRLITSENSKRIATFGTGISIGTTKRADDLTRYEYIYDASDSTYLELIGSRSIDYFQTRYSNSSFGGYIDMGQQFRVFSTFSADIRAQLHAHIPTYGGSLFDPHYGELFIEPSLTVALRWDFERHR